MTLCAHDRALLEGRLDVFYQEDILEDDQLMEAIWNGIILDCLLELNDKFEPAIQFAMLEM